MKYVLVNPNWSFEGSIYFGCRHPHLPLEYGYADQLLRATGHETLLIDAHLFGLTPDEVKAQVKAFEPDITVITTAPSYLFWRCAPPELRVPIDTVDNLRPVSKVVAIVGPHGSTTPSTTLRKTGADVVVMGECEDVLPQLSGPWGMAQSITYWLNGKPWVQGATNATDLSAMPALHWPAEMVRAHLHHHHRFDATPAGPGAEVEASRGCPYHCTFCAKDNFRDKYRRRPVAIILDEVQGLLDQGVEYIYFIDEIFLPNTELLEGLVGRKLKFGVQTRVDLWSEPMLELLGRAGCVSLEAGVESITEAGRESLDKKCKMSTSELSARLTYAKRYIPFVQANLIQMDQDDINEIDAWRQNLLDQGVWANKPVPLYPYPGSPSYTKLWGAPDHRAWERAHEHYLSLFSEFSDIQEQTPSSLEELELKGLHRG